MESIIVFKLFTSSIKLHFSSFLGNLIFFIIHLCLFCVFIFLCLIYTDIYIKCQVFFWGLFIIQKCDRKYLPHYLHFGVETLYTNSLCEIRCTHIPMSEIIQTAMVIRDGQLVMQQIISIIAARIAVPRYSFVS